jgi:hypothetical protein
VNIGFRKKLGVGPDLRLAGLALAWIMTFGLNAQNSKEFVYFGSRVVAIEASSSASNGIAPDQPGAQVAKNTSRTIRTFDANGLPQAADEWRIWNVVTQQVESQYRFLSTIQGVGDSARSFTGTANGSRA